MTIEERLENEIDSLVTNLGDYEHLRRAVKWGIKEVLINEESRIENYLKELKENIEPLKTLIENIHDCSKESTSGHLIKISKTNMLQFKNCIDYFSENIKELNLILPKIDTSRKRIEKRLYYSIEGLIEKDSVQIKPYLRFISKVESPHITIEILNSIDNIIKEDSSILGPYLNSMENVEDDATKKAITLITEAIIKENKKDELKPYFENVSKNIIIFNETLSKIEGYSQKSCLSGIVMGMLRKVPEQVESYLKSIQENSELIESVHSITNSDRAIKFTGTIAEADINLMGLFLNNMAELDMKERISEAIDELDDCYREDPSKLKLALQRVMRLKSKKDSDYHPHMYGKSENYCQHCRDKHARERKY